MTIKKAWKSGQEAKKETYKWQQKGEKDKKKGLWDRRMRGGAKVLRKSYWYTNPGETKC